MCDKVMHWACRASSSSPTQALLPHGRVVACWRRPDGNGQSGWARPRRACAKPRHAGRHLARHARAVSSLRGRAARRCSRVRPAASDELHRRSVAIARRRLRSNYRHFATTTDHNDLRPLRARLSVQGALLRWRRRYTMTPDRSASATAEDRQVHDPLAEGDAGSRRARFSRTRRISAPRRSRCARRRQRQFLDSLGLLHARRRAAERARPLFGRQQLGKIAPPPSPSHALPLRRSPMSPPPPSS